MTPAWRRVASSPERKLMSSLRIRRRSRPRPRTEVPTAPEAARLSATPEAARPPVLHQVRAAEVEAVPLAARPADLLVLTAELVAVAVEGLEAVVVVQLVAVEEVEVVATSAAVVVAVELRRDAASRRVDARHKFDVLINSD